jgi:hypothetical protein
MMVIIYIYTFSLLNGTALPSTWWPTTLVMNMQENHGKLPFSAAHFNEYQLG